VIPQGDREHTLQYFRRMKQLFENLKHIRRQNFSMEILSMGMTGDYREAIEAGSNMIRVGEGIFGKRNYNK
ncbi:MAG TPA: YggS family pyridoxal phosphate-dependent enzyme, partial [Clostridiaceae bacterium]|nr:YggS family pyridoxal phosphate-dependent enzyme [Clostridiaceae bacterium]